MATVLINRQTQSTLHSAARFMIVGFLGTIIDLSLFAILHVQLGLPTLLANSLSYSAGILNNYFLHRKWTFAHRSQKAASKQFVQFAGVSLSALAVNNLVMVLLTPALHILFPDQFLDAVLAKICAIGIGVAWNFLANYFWTFRPAQSL